jgi:hypothetical protein
MHAFKTKNSKELEFKRPQALHGDVIIEKIKSLPKDFEEMEKLEDDCLAYGEATGHSHKLFRMMDPELPTAVSFDLRIAKDGTRYLHVENKTELRHQEHDPRVIPPGDYKISIQREFDPFEKLTRKVTD